MKKIILVWTFLICSISVKSQSVTNDPVARRFVNGFGASQLNTPNISQAGWINYFPSVNKFGGYDGTAYRYWATETWTQANFYPLTGNPSGFLTAIPTLQQVTTSGATSSVNVGLTGNLGIGTTTPASARLQIEDQSGLESFTISKYNDAANGGLLASRARGTVASPTAVLANDRLLAILGRGYRTSGGNAFNGYSAAINIYASENLSSTANGSYISFETTNTGTTSRTERLRILPNGNVGFGLTSTTARLGIGAGTSAIAPLKFTSGTLLTTPEAGAVEFLNDKYYVGISTASARKEITLNEGVLNSNTVPYSNANGRLENSSVTPTELQNLSGSTANIQNQLNLKVPETRAVNSGIGLIGGGGLAIDRTLSVDTTVIATKANSNTLAQLQTRFAAKQNNITLTTTGTSGAATLVGSTLNIPQYAGGGSSYTFSNGLTNLSSNVTLGGDIVSPTVFGLTGTNSINISGGTGVSNSGFLNIGGGSGSTNIIGYASSGSSRSIQFSNTAMTVNDAISNKGLVYAGNYGVNFTDLSLITKKYADSLYATVSGSSPWSRSSATISPTTANDKVVISGAISGFALDVTNTQAGNTAIRATAPTGGNGLLAQGGASGIGVRATSTGTTVNDAAIQATNSNGGQIALFGNSGGTKATIDNNGMYNFISDPTAFLTSLSAVPKQYVDNLIPQIVEVAGTTQTLQATRTYILHNASLTTCTLPTTANIGDLISIIGEGAGGFRVAQNASQFIVSGNATSTTGTSGYIQSTTNNTFVSLRYVASNKWMVTSSNSAITIN